MKVPKMMASELGTFAYRREVLLMHQGPLLPISLDRIHPRKYMVPIPYVFSDFTRTLPVQC